MAGEFLKVWASLERMKQAEARADASIVSKAVSNKRAGELKLHLAKLGEQQQVDKMLLNQSLRDLDKNKTILKNKEQELRDLGVTINEHNSLNEDDKSKDASSILDFTYGKVESEEKKAKENISYTLQQKNNYEEKNDQVLNKISQLNDRLDTFNKIDLALEGYSSDLFNLEANQIAGDFAISDKEMDIFYQLHTQEIDDLAEQFGGGQEGRLEVELRLRRNFSKYSDDKLMTLNRVMMFQKSKQQIAENKIKLKALGPGGAAVGEKLRKDLSNDIGELNSAFSSLAGNLDFTVAQIEETPILKHLKVNKQNKASDITGFNIMKDQLDKGMAGFINKLEELEAGQLPSKYQNEHPLLAKWFSGLISLMDEKDLKRTEGDYHYKDKQGNKYEYISDVNIQAKYAQERINSLDLKSGKIKNPEIVLEGVLNFLNLYSAFYDREPEIRNQQYVLESFAGFKVDSLTSGNKQPTNPKDKDGNVILNDNDQQESLELIKKIEEFSNKNNIEPSAIEAEAEEMEMSIEEYIDTFSEDLTMPSLLDQQQAEELYTGGEEYTKYGSSKEGERGAEIIERINQIEKEKKIAFDSYMNQFGDITRQKTAKDRWFNRGFMGAPWEKLHEEGAGLVDELKEINKLAIKAKIKDGSVDLFSHFIETGTGKKYKHRKHILNPDWDLIDLVEKAEDFYTKERLASMLYNDIQ